MPKDFIQDNHIPLFQSLSEDELTLLVEKLDELHFQAGETIIREGEQGDCMFLLRNGVVRVFAQIPEGGDEITLSRLEAGDYFGEMALITGDTRSASVQAVTDVKLWKLSKTDFDELIKNYPDITLSLTHMLSQRLKHTNKALELSEKQIRERFIPQGTLDAVDVISLLKFAEENSLTGYLEIRNEEDKALFTFEKGQLKNLDYNGKEETEAMDEILLWKAGRFTIEPEMFNLNAVDAVPEQGKEDSLQKNDVDKPEQPVENEGDGTVIREDYSNDSEWDVLTPVELFNRYLSEKVGEFNRFAGLQVTKNALRQSYIKFRDYFDVINDIEIESSPEVRIEIRTDNWSEKHTLFAAILLRSLVNIIERDVIGIAFWNPESAHSAINEQLKIISYFEYFEQATDFVRV